MDLSFTPAGTEGFVDLDQHALPMTLRGITIRVAALEDIIRSKAAANRPKDQRSLPTLRLLLEELRKQKGEDHRS